MLMNSQQPQREKMSMKAFALLLASLCLLGGVKAFQQIPIFPKHSNPMTMYMPSNGPISQTASLTAQRMLKNPGNPHIKEMVQNSKFKLSNSVLASCDTLPSFPTAHGLLSPETVFRLEESTRESGTRSEALNTFLKTYRRHGPLSCLPMLSDPEILPHLTKAMRDLVA